MCVHLYTRVLRPTLLKVKQGVLHFLPCLRRGLSCLLLLYIVHTDEISEDSPGPWVAGLRWEGSSCRDSPVSASHLATQVQSLQTCTAMPGSWWLLGIWTQVIRLVWQGFW